MTPDVQGWIEAALQRSGATHDIADVAAMIESGEARLFQGRQAALVAVIEDHPTGLALCLWLAGGDQDELINDLRPKAESWGRESGCDRSMIMGRRGWIKALKRHDYRPRAVVLVKELPDG